MKVIPQLGSLVTSMFVGFKGLALRGLKSCLTDKKSIPNVPVVIGGFTFEQSPSITLSVILEEINEMGYATMEKFERDPKL